MKLRRNKILNFFTISLLAGYCLNADIAFASNSDACPHLDINESTNICEQNARHLALENNLKILITFRQRNIEIKEEPILIEEELIKTTDKTDYSPNVIKTEVSTPLDFDV